MLISTHLSRFADEELQPMSDALLAASRPAEALSPNPRHGEAATMANPASSFIWYELMTPDPAGSKRFYDAVVAGWTVEAQPSGTMTTGSSPEATAAAAAGSCV
jgi:hypothetical protein